MAWLDRLKQGLSKTRKGLIGKIENVISSRESYDPELLEEIEELLVTSDIGVDTSMELVESIRKRAEEEDISEPEKLEEWLRKELEERLDGAERDLNMRDGDEPTVILVTGVNGSGKTTTLAKLAKKFKDSGKDVVLAASDTFRAAAIEQLQEWADQTGVDMISHQIGADPSAVAYDALEHTINTQKDVLLIDTAGRLQTKHNLMQELEKIDNVLKKKLGRELDEKLLTIDATNGQNGISQAEKFDESIGLTGLVLTKLDSTAKGGVIFPIVEKLGLGVSYIGVGEEEEDLHEFDKDEFIRALFG